MNKLNQSWIEILIEKQIESIVCETVGDYGNTIKRERIKIKTSDGKELMIILESSINKCCNVNLSDGSLNPKYYSSLVYRF